MLHTSGSSVSYTNAELWQMKNATTVVVPFSNEIISTQVRNTHTARGHHTHQQTSVHLKLNECWETTYLNYYIHVNDDLCVHGQSKQTRQLDWNIAAKSICLRI